MSVRMISMVMNATTLVLVTVELVHLTINVHFVKTLYITARIVSIDVHADAILENVIKVPDIVFYGCKPGYTGDKCDTCSPKLCDLYCIENNCSSCISKANCIICKEGLYGETCTLSCPSGCKGKCSISDGRCSDCKPGFYGEWCNNTCLDGTYGYNCSRQCNTVDKNCLVCFADEFRQYGGCIQCNRGHYPVFPFGQNHSTCFDCPPNCKDNECNTLGLCSRGCLRGNWGDDCNNYCTLSCIECNQTDGKCLECTNETLSDDCSQNCSTDCNTTGSGRICDSNTGKCLHGCLTFTKYGDYCEKECNDNCINKVCDWKKGHCFEGCVKHYYGSFCDKKCANTCESNKDRRVCEDGNGHCVFGCKNGFFGDGCKKNCSSQCINKTCIQTTGLCLHGCKDGLKGVNCVQAPEGTGSELKLTVVLAASAVAFIMLVVITAICIVKRKRKQRIPSNKKCEENDYIQDMQEICKQNDISETEADVTYAQLLKSKRERVNGSVKEYATAHNNEMRITDTNNDYAIVDKQKSVRETNEIIDEVYDSTYDNKNKRPFNSNNEYAVLSLKSYKPIGICKQKGAQSENGPDTYDTTEENKIKNILLPNNDYSSITNKGNILETECTSPLYDTTSKEANKKMRPVKNDYNFFTMNS